MFVNFVAYIMLIMFMAKSRYIAGNIINMFYFLCKTITTIKINTFIYFNDIAIIISLYSIVFINYHTIHKELWRVYFSCGISLIP